MAKQVQSPLGAWSWWSVICFPNWELNKVQARPLVIPVTQAMLRSIIFGRMSGFLFIFNKIGFVLGNMPTKKNVGLPGKQFSQFSHIKRNGSSVSFVSLFSLCDYLEPPKLTPSPPTSSFPPSLPLPRSPWTKKKFSTKSSTRSATMSRLTSS